MQNDLPVPSDAVGLPALSEQAMAPALDPGLLMRVVEAALLASAHPLSLSQLAALFPDEAAADETVVRRAIDALMQRNDERGVALVEVASGYRYQVQHDLQPWVARLWTERPARYSRALLETLALIAYRQPITRGEIEQIRGVAVSSHIVKTLEEREWVRVVGHRDVPGRPALFGTTRGFLDYFGLRSLDQLPPLTELQDIPDLEPELPLPPLTAAVRADETLAEPEPGADPQASLAIDGPAPPAAPEPTAVEHRVADDENPTADADLVDPLTPHLSDSPEATDSVTPEHRNHD